MKAVLEFNLPEDKEEFEDAQLGTKATSALYDMMQLFREHTKDRNPDKDYKTPSDLIEKLREEFIEIIEQNNIPRSKL